MPRCKKQRCCRYLESELVYIPVGQPCNSLTEVVIEADEFEAMRLCDLEALDQTEAGACLGVSRGTVQRLLDSARRKMMEALMHSQAIRIQNSMKPKGDLR